MCIGEILSLSPGDYEDIMLFLEGALMDEVKLEGRFGIKANELDST